MRPASWTEYGYRLHDGAYVPEPAEQAAIAEIVALRAQGLTWQSIANALNAEGVAPPSGAEWYPMTARRIGQREAGERSARGEQP